MTVRAITRAGGPGVEGAPDPPGPLGLVDTTGRHPVWLIRHAPTSWTGRRWCGRADPRLGPSGRSVAERLAADLAAELPADVRIRSSPARRAHATALAIASSVGGSVALDDDLLEVDVGRVEGWTWDELANREPTLAAAILDGRAIDWPGGETRAAVALRARRAAERIAVAATERAVVVVSHGALIHELRRALGEAGLRPVDAASSVPLSAAAPLAAGGVLRLVPSRR